MLEDKQFHIHHGDAIPHMFGEEGGMPAKSVDFAVFSPPFPFLIRIHGFQC